MTSEASQHEKLTAASPVKLWASGLVASETAGRVIGALTRNRIRHQGLWFDTRSADFSPKVRAQMFWGGYEGAETRMIRSFLRDSPAVVELGSSLGVTTAHIAAVMAPGGHLVCVEANPRLIRGLNERAAPHTAGLQYEVIHAAVTRHCGTAELVIAGETVGSRIGAPRPDESVVPVPALTLREILRRTNVGEFDLVSDIEGAEAAFLLDDPGVLSKCGRAVIEFHQTVADGRMVSVFDLIDAAVAVGFRVVSRHGPVVALSRSLSGRCPHRACTSGLTTRSREQTSQVRSLPPAEFQRH